MQLPSPPDERIDAPPEGFRWAEHIRPNGASVTFRGRRAPTRFGFWLLVVVVTCAFVAFGRSSSGGVGGKEVAGAIGLLLLAASLAWRWRTSAVSAGAVDIDASRVRIEPVGLLARSREVALAEVDYFSAETQIETWTTGSSGARRLIEAYRWYPIYLRLTSGERLVLAAFAEREQALFLAQRLQMLAERARSVAGLRRDPKPIVPKPYR